MAGFILGQPREIIHAVIPAHDHFPNNSRYPLILYKDAVHCPQQSVELIKNLLQENHWLNAWVDGIYDYHHYHSNTHETLVICSGTCKVQVGGPKGTIYVIEQGDVIIFPAGVAHKNVGCSTDFQCIGAYPLNIDYDMNYGKAEEHPQVDSTIKQVPLPLCDPIFGPQGVLFDYWK